MSSDLWSEFTKAYAMPAALNAQKGVERQFDLFYQLPEPKLPLSISGEMDWMIV
jgi:hypothetical protein